MIHECPIASRDELAGLGNPRRRRGFSGARVGPRWPSPTRPMPVRFTVRAPGVERTPWRAPRAVRYGYLPSLTALPGIAELGALGNPRRRKRGGGFWGFIKGGGIVGLIGRQRIVRKILPRPITSIMRAEPIFAPKQFAGSIVRELKAPIKPVIGLVSGMGGKKKRRPAPPEEQPPDAQALFPAPWQSVPAPPPPTSMTPGEFAPAPSTPAYDTAAAQYQSKDYAEPAPGDEELGPDDFSETESGSLVPGAAEYAYPERPEGLAPGETFAPEPFAERRGPEAALMPVTEPMAEEQLAPEEGYELPGPPGAELTMSAGPQLMVRGPRGAAPVFWYQATPPTERQRRFARRPILYVDELGQAEWFVRPTAEALKAAAAILPSAERAFAPSPQFVAPPAVVRPPAVTGASWLWPVLGLGAVGIGIWIFTATPKRQRVR